MNAIIANALKGRLLSSITWADRVFGMVKTLTYGGGNEMSGTISIPISCDIEANQRDCISKTEHHAVPDSKLKALIYFEDGGATTNGATARGISFTANLTLVCWINLQNLGQTSCSASAFAQVQIIEALNGFTANVSPLNTIRVNEISIIPKSANIFSKYTYQEKQIQYLMYPYDYFALSLRISFEVPRGCINDSWVENPIPCLN